MAPKNVDQRDFSPVPVWAMPLYPQDQGKDLVEGLNDLWKQSSGGVHRENGGKTLAHTIHVWDIYLHEWLIFKQMLVNIPYMDAMGWDGTLNNQPH